MIRSNTRCYLPCPSVIQLRCLRSPRVDLGRVIGAKAQHHGEKRQPFAKVTDIFHR